VKISFNIWNIGEVLKALDRARNIGGLGSESYLIARKRFSVETKRMIDLNILVVILLERKSLLTLGEFLRSTIFIKLMRYR
jgi:predicted nucleic acid-binding protein